jgi:monovalent cation/hydrogen antiporter
MNADGPWLDCACKRLIGCGDWRQQRVSAALSAFFLLFHSSVMTLFEITVALLLLGAVLAAWARRLHAPDPAFLAIAGAALALIPGTPSLSLEPTLVMTLFVAPTLLDAAYDMSLRDLRIYWMPIAASAVIAVVLTVASVAVLAHALRRDMSWPVAIVLGAIVSPPDASAAVAVLRSLRPPHRVMVILQGESLLNDATALLIYRAAVLAAAGAWGGWGTLPTSLGAILGSVALGVILGTLFPRLSEHIADFATAVIAQFVSTFAVWILRGGCGDTSRQAPHSGSGTTGVARPARTD